MSDAILISGGLIPSERNSFVDKRGKVPTFADIANIENPALYMTIVVEETGRKYEVRKLTSKIIGGIPVSNAAIDINDPDALFDLGLAEEQRVEDEKVRQANEEARKMAENKRIEDESKRKSNESARETAENQRIANEKDRNISEKDRKTSEQSRESDETKRQKQESIRLSQESSRVSAENTRVANENARKESESERKTSETKRKTSEQSRKDAESIRVKNELNRTASETDRINAEDIRVSNEEKRIANENERKSAELSREQAEGFRSTTFETLKGEMQTTIQEGQTANTLSEQATNRANEAAETIESWESVVVTVDDEGDVNDPEADIVNEAIRKTPQTLTKAEQAQARTNIGAASLEENTAFKTELTESNEAFKTEVSENFEEYKEQTDEELDNKIKEMYEVLGGESLYYGVEFDTAVSTNAFVRIGNSTLHRTLPIQNRMKGCLLDDDGNVVEYLNPSDWTGNTRDGSRGQVMVEIPDIYWKFETDGTKRRVKISEYSLPGFFLVPKHYVSAYEASVQRSTTKLCSVVNSDVDYRGGNNTTSYDGTYRSLLGRPATSISRTNFRNYARKRKEGSTEWNCMLYGVDKWVYWLFVIEYATLDSQDDYNAELDANGYRQGGLGEGVTTWSDSAWSRFNGYNPFIPCGHTDSLGNRTGTVEYEVLDAEGAVLKTFNVPRYRGIENPFGHIWKWVDGINIRISPTEENGGDGLSKVFVCSDPAKFNDSNYNGYRHVGNCPRESGYGLTHIFGEYGEMIAETIGAGSTTGLCDRFYTIIPEVETLRGVLFGGTAHNGAYAGFAYATTFNVPSHAAANFGSRLCFIPAN